MKNKKIKRILVIWAIFFVSHLLMLNSWALTYLDDFTDTENNNIKQYFNLKPFPLDSASYSTLPDRTAFSFASTSTPYGYATYQVRNAESVTVGFYTQNGSYVQQYGVNGPLVLGSVEGNINTVLDVDQAEYSLLKCAVYAKYNDEYYQMHTNTVMKIMLRPDDPGFNGTRNIPEDRIGYGTNVYASTNGNNWTRIPLTYKKHYFVVGSLFFYEEMTGSIPIGTRYIRVDLNDVLNIPYVGGGYLPVVNSRRNSLASVSFTGKNLIVGVPEAYTEQPVMPEFLEEESFSEDMWRAESSSEPESKNPSEPEDESDPETEIESEPEDESDPETEIESEPEDEPDPETGIESEPEDESDPETEVESEPEDESDPETEIESEPEDESGSDNQSSETDKEEKSESSSKKSSSSKSSSSSKASSSSKSSSSSKTSSTASSSSQRESASSTTSSSSKFEGVITSSSTSSANSSSQSTAQITTGAVNAYPYVIEYEPKSTTSTRNTVTANSSETPEILYTVPTSDSDDDTQFTSFFHVYIVVVTGVLIFVLVRPFIKK